MNRETLQQIADRLLDWSGAPLDVNVVWHAGEPLIMRRSFYDQAIASISVLERRGIKVTHSIQTNGVLIDTEWARFFRDSGMIVGVSIDGPADIHDASRKYRNGNGSFEATLKGINCLKNSDVGFHTISVVTTHSLSRSKDIFDFFLMLDPEMVCFNVEELEGTNNYSSLSGTEIPRLYKSFLEDFVRYNAISGSPLRIREAEAYASSVMSIHALSNSQVIAGEILTIDTSGNVFTFSPELAGLKADRYNDFIIGNVYSESIDSMLSGKVATEMSLDISEGVELCRETCPWFWACGGGAPSNKFFETGSFRTSETMFCRLNIMATYSACENVLKSELCKATP